MTEKEHTILYDRNARKLILTGSFLSDTERFRQHLFKAVYMKNEYDALDEENLAKPRTIQFIMTNCPGGIVADMFALLALIRLTKKELPNLTLNLLCCGRIQSAATLFMISEVFSRVIIDRYCTVQIHNVETTFKGDNSFKKRRLDALAKSAEQTETLMCKLYADAARRRGKSEREWQKIIDDGNNRTDILPEELLEIGLCDEIL